LIMASHTPLCRSISLTLGILFFTTPSISYAQDRPDCTLDFTVLNDLDAENGTAAFVVEGISRFFNSKMSKLQLSWALDEFEKNTIVPASAFFAGRGHLFEVVIAEAPGGLPYRLVAVEHHGAAKSPVDALASSYSTDRLHAAPSDPMKVSDRSFFLWYSAPNGRTKAECIMPASASGLRAEAQDRVNKIRKMDRDLQGRAEVRARAGQWEALASQATAQAYDAEVAARLTQLEAQRLEIDRAWEKADQELQRELQQQRRLRSDAGFIAIMQVVLSGAQLVSSLQSQPTASIANGAQLSTNDSPQMISSKVNTAIIQTNDRITRIRTEISEFEKKTDSIENQLRNEHLKAKTPRIAIP
jgi:hypothetical protein